MRSHALTTPVSSSLKCSNCYMVWGGDFVSSGHQGRISHTDLVIGCLVDLATGLMTFTANGKESNTFFQVSPALSNLAIVSSCPSMLGRSFQSPSEDRPQGRPDREVPGRPLSQPSTELTPRKEETEHCLDLREGSTVPLGPGDTNCQLLTNQGTP